MIRFENVSKTYKNGTVALRDVSLNIEKGEFVFLVGSSGSGKTTCLRLLLREESPDAGRILELGRDIGTMPKWRVPYLRRNIGCVFQDFRLLPTKTVFENVAFAQEVIGRPRSTVESQVPQILELVGLADKRNNLPSELSGGEQQRVAVARAFVNRPLVLLADEPTGNLDPTNSEQIMTLLERINKTGTTVVMATHDKGLVDRMRRRVIELDGANSCATNCAACTALMSRPEVSDARVSSLRHSRDVQQSVAKSTHDVGRGFDRRRVVDPRGSRTDVQAERVTGLGRLGTADQSDRVDERLGETRRNEFD